MSSTDDAAVWLRDCDAVGANARLRGKPVIKNEGRIEIGKGFQLSSAPVVSHIAVWPDGLVEIDDDVAIAHGAAIACMSRVRIGAGARIGAFFVLADSDFHVAGDRRAIPDPRPIDIGRNVRIGARVNVLPGAVIGDGAVVLAGSTVAGNVSAGAVVSGVPARDKESASHAHGEVLEERIRKLVARVLGLDKLPELSDGPKQIAEWDSLGALRILLAVEDQCEVRLDERDLARLSSVAALASIVEAKRA